MPIDLGGFNVEFGALMEPICGIKVDYILDSWDQCWTSKPTRIYFPEITGYVGEGIAEGRVHGCTAYTHTKGERGLSLEFTDSILGGLKTAGILTRLVGGVPVVSPSLVDYTGIPTGDVTGWAPTADTFVYNHNECVAGAPQFMKTDALLQPSGGDGPVAGIRGLLASEYDALYIYADQLYNFLAAGTNTDITSQFGTNYAFIHTGLDDWSINGTTLAISKRGSGLKNVLDPCIAKVVQTQQYTTLCESYFNPSTCIQNSFSTGSGPSSYFYDNPMSARTDSLTCTDGYCPCGGSGQPLMG